MTEGQLERSTRALLRQRILRKCKYPTDQQDDAVDLALRQAETLGAEWIA